MRKRRKSRGRLWLAAVVVVVVVGALVVLGLYGGSLGIAGLSSLGSSPSKDTITLSNVNMTSFPGVQDGYTGIGISANILNNAAVQIQNTTIFLNGVSLGSCITTTIQAHQQIVCKAGSSVGCNVMPASPPYTIKAQVGFVDGTTYIAAVQITSQLTTTC